MRRKQKNLESVKPDGLPHSVPHLQVREVKLCGVSKIDILTIQWMII